MKFEVTFEDKFDKRVFKETVEAISIISAIPIVFEKIGTAKYTSEAIKIERIK